MSAELPAVISASPRPGGNSDRAAATFAQGVGEVLGQRPRVTMLRRFEVLPCQACYRCEHDPDGQCYLGAYDQSGALFALLCDAPSLFIAAPIFFYHLPAQFKCLIDRGQSYWLRKRAGDPALTGLPRRPASICLVAGRPRGDQLFQGSLLTLKYFLEIFNFEIAETLTLQGLEGAGDLAAHPELRASLMDLGRRAAG